MNISELIRKEVARAIGRAGNVVRRVLLTVAPGDDYFGQVTGAGDDIFDGVELWQQFGLASRPPVGGEGLVLCPGGAGEGGILVATQDRAHRPALAAGETALHGLATAGTVKMRADGAIDATPGAGKTVNLGGDTTACTDFVLKGTTFKFDFVTTFLAAWKAALASSSPPATDPNWIAYKAAMAPLIGALETAAASWLSTSAKVK